MDNSFGNWLKKQLEDRDMTQAEFARRIDVHQAHISHLLNGDRNPTIEIMEKIANVFRVPPEEIFKIYIDKPTNLKSESQSKKDKIIEKIDRILVDLPEKDQQEFLEIAKLKARLAEGKTKYDTKTNKSTASASE